MLRAQHFADDLALLDAALKVAPKTGLILEFGVASGRTINHIAKQTDRVIHGFDVFSGLPEDWRSGFNQGHFAQELPQVQNNVRLHVGLFSKTLPEFLQENAEPLALLHVDCDLYSSTRDIFKAVNDRIMPGVVIVFDEYFNYPGWRHHEWKAFQEFTAEQSISYDYLGFVSRNQKVAVVVR